MRRVEVKRRMGEADIAAVSALLHAAAQADGHQPLGEHKWLDLVHGGRKGFAGFVAWEPGHSHPVGYAQVGAGRQASWSVEYVVDPHHRTPEARVGHDLVRAALDQIRSSGGGHVHMWVPKPGPEDDAVARDNGLSPGRELYQMRRPLPIPPPAGSSDPGDDDGEMVLRPFRTGVDEGAWLAVNNRAFAAHPEQGAWDAQTLTDREAEPWFDPDGFLLHERDGRLAGSCWTKIHHDHSPPLGEIYVISVDPDFQGLGLGRRLCLAGLAYLAGRGVTVGMLYVDESNEAAVTMYRHLGFDVDHVDRAYVGDV